MAVAELWTVTADTAVPPTTYTWVNDFRPHRDSLFRGRLIRGSDLYVSIYGKSETQHKKACLLKLVKAVNFINKENSLTSKSLLILGTFHSFFNVSDAGHCCRQRHKPHCCRHPTFLFNYFCQSCLNTHHTSLPFVKVQHFYANRRQKFLCHQPSPVELSTLRQLMPVLIALSNF